MFLLTIVSCLVSMSLSAEITCGPQSVDKLDENVKKMAVLGDPNRRYPSNDQDAISHCQADLMMTNWGMNYAKTCLLTQDVEISRHVTHLLMFAMQKVSKKRCRSENTRKGLLMAGKCGNAAKTETQKCFNQYIMESEQINRSKKTLVKNEKHLLPLICCAYHKFYDCCSEAYANPNVAHVCTEKAARELEGYTQHSMYDVIQYLCGDYQGSDDKCDGLLRRYQNVFNTVRVKSLPISPLGPSNEVFNSLPGI